MKTTENPHYEGFFMYGDNKPHCWSGPVSSADRLKEMAQFIQRKRPRARRRRGGRTERAAKVWLKPDTAGFR